MRSILQNFANEPEEKQHPGFFTENLYASPPLIFDSAGTAAQAFAAAYTGLTGTLAELDRSRRATTPRAC